MRRTSWSIIVPIVVVLSACGSGSSAIGGNGVGTRSIPTGAGEVVFRVDTRGGFTSLDYQLGIVPQVTVYGDGRVIVLGPTTEQYPPHALPNLRTGTLDHAAVEHLARRATELGLLARHDYGRPTITDNPTTTVTINVDGAHAHAAYALDNGAANAPGLSASEREARTSLTTFVHELSSAAQDAAGEPYEPAEVAVYVQPADMTHDGPPTAVDPGSRDWPLGDLTLLGVSDPPAPMPSRWCAVLTGADATTALGAAAGATAITRWSSNGSDFTIVWRPLLPDEHACP